MNKTICLKTNLYSLRISHKTKKTVVRMDVESDLLLTSQLPLTIQILDEMLPSIFNSKCFNDDNLTFRDEAENTEIGHLFEHILLEYLCKTKVKDGFKGVTFRGETSWNWVKYKRGVFLIEFDVCQDDKKYFYLALERSIVLINLIFQSRSIAYKQKLNSEGQYNFHLIPRNDYIVRLNQ